MQSPRVRRVIALAMMATTTAGVTLLAGCSNKDDTAGASDKGSVYYTGPMKSKSERGAKGPQGGGAEVPAPKKQNAP